MAAALEELGREGLAGFSIESVAKRVGLVPSGLYRHFRSRRAIVEASIAAIGERLGELVRGARRNDPPALVALQRLLFAHLGMLASGSGIARVMFGDVLFGRDAELRRIGQRVVEDYLSAVADLARIGQEEGSLRRDLAPEDVALLYLGLIQPLAVLHELHSGRLDILARGAATWEIFAEGIRAGASSPTEASLT